MSTMTPCARDGCREPTKKSPRRFCSRKCSAVVREANKAPARRAAAAIVLDRLAIGDSFGNAAHAAGVTARTVRNWCAAEPGYAAEVARLRDYGAFAGLTGA